MKYKDGIVLEDCAGIMYGSYSSGLYRIVCPKCKIMAMYPYTYTEKGNTIPKYCAYCGEKLLEEEQL